jgi:transcriptional regulator with GAF, ATPase, and Fis domain
MSAAATANYSLHRNRVLIASADPAFRDRLRKHRDYVYFTSEEAVGGAHALAKLHQFPCQSVLLDRNLPDLDAGEVAQIIRDKFPSTTVEVIDSLGDEVEAALLEPCVVEVKPAESRVTEIMSPQRKSPTHPNSEGGEESDTLPGMIGASAAMQQVYQMVRMVAKRDTTVLITGETGTGKEVVANAIHQLSLRSRQSLVVVNCAAIPETLLESELFGHARGAFTGALQSRAGRIQAAQGGTLFLDEIGELPLSMQAKLLRFLQNGEVQRLGSAETERVNARVIAATNAPLMDLIRKKQFRQDLFYRLAVFPIELPALRDRVADIKALAEYFLVQLSSGNSAELKSLSPNAIAYLHDAPWPGNVRELQYAVERASILSGDESELRVGHFQYSGNTIRMGEI